MSYVAKKLSSGLLFDPQKFSFHPLIAMIVLVTQFGLFITQKNEVILAVLILTVIENFLFRNIAALIDTILGLMPAIIFTLVLSIPLAGLQMSYLLLMKLLVGASIISIFFNHVNPSDLARTLETLRFPAFLAFLPPLAMTMVPRITKDANETIETLRMRGEIKGFFIKWLPKTFAIFIASSLYRTQFLAQALYFKGFGITKRSHYKKHSINVVEVLRMVFWITIVSLIISDYIMDFIPTFFVLPF